MLASITLAQTRGGYDLTWSTIDGGGAMFSTSGSYALGGTVGQAKAGAFSGGGYMLTGGFWSGITDDKRISAAGGQVRAPDWAG